MDFIPSNYDLLLVSFIDLHILNFVILIRLKIRCDA